MNETYPIGTIAVITPGDEPAVLAFRMNGFWATPTRKRMVTTGDAAVTDARPLVVIDPEDREQVERLMSTFHAQYNMPWSSDSDAMHADRMQAALREFATPTPKPEEPKGWGAVVEDDTGAMWTLYAPEAGAWINYREGKRLWSGIDAVRVVSEGVQP